MSKIRRELEALKAENELLKWRQAIDQDAVALLTAERDEAEDANRKLLSKLMLMEEQANMEDDDAQGD